MKGVDLSVVVVTWNTRRLALECLEALERETERCRRRAPWIESEIAVVDNGSSDGTADAIRSRFPRARVVRLARNAGFAAGANAGLRRARGRVVLLLNSDTRVQPGALAACVGYLDRHPDVGIVGPQLLHSDGSRQNSVHHFPRLVAELLPKGLLQLLFRRRFPSQRWTRADGPIDVEAVSGAALFARRELVREVGPLSERYFFFLEETDWCWRARSSGWRVVHLPAARVVHHLGASSKRPHPALTRIEYHRSLYRFYRERRGSVSMAMVLSLRFAKALLYVVTQAPFAVVDSRRRRRWRAHCAVFAWHLRGCPASVGLQQLSPGEAGAA
ncbi:MAG: glycosyltransferase family 2 protein [Myxococcota bacterium]